MSQFDPFDPFDPPNPPSRPGQGLSPWEMQSPGAPSPSVEATMNQMTERLQTVIEAAERAADAIRYDAEEQARRHLAEAQRKADRMTAERVRLISELTDDLIRHAGQVRDHSELMVRSLEDAISSVTGKLEQPGLESEESLPRFEEPPPLPSEPIAAEPTPESQNSSTQQPVSQATLLYATRLAVAGNDRDTIARALRDDHGVADPDEVVDRVLGTARR